MGQKNVTVESIRDLIRELERVAGSTKTTSLPSKLMTPEQRAKRLRPYEGLVIGKPIDQTAHQNVFLILSRCGERLIDYFIDDDDASATDSTVQVFCGFDRSGRVEMRPIDWELDGFLSEIFDQE